RRDRRNRAARRNLGALSRRGNRTSLRRVADEAGRTRADHGGAQALGFAGPPRTALAARRSPPYARTTKDASGQNHVAAVFGSRVRRGLSTASPTSGMTPSRQRRIS